MFVSPEQGMTLESNYLYLRRRELIYKATICVCTSGVQDPDFGAQSSRIYGFIWIGYRFPFNRIRIIQVK